MSVFPLLVISIVYTPTEDTYTNTGLAYGGEGVELLRVNLSVNVDKAWKEESEHLIGGYAGICSLAFGFIFPPHSDDHLLQRNKL